VDDAVERLIRLSGLVEHLEAQSDRDPAAEDRVENLNQLLERAAEHREAAPEADLPAFLEEIALVADVDQWESGADLVSLMTLHSAKGLEFPCVFITGCEEGLLPHENADGPAAMEEERRLFYVGMTRARERLHLTHAVMRFRWGETRVAPPSPFLREIPDETVEATDLTETAGAFGPAGDTAADADPFPDIDDVFAEDAGWDDAFDAVDEPPPGEPGPHAAGGRLRRRRAPGGGGTDVRAGDLVRHPVFGKGKVLSASRRQAVIQFFAAGTRALHLESANLRRC
jgi:DNA helicase-2/ATP-dependent DNA helicase PcrA